MKTISTKSTVNIEFAINLSLTLGEARALSAIVGYGHQEFLNQFYKLGKAYLQPHEKDLIELFKKLKDTLPTEIHKIEDVNRQINDALDEIK